MKVCRRVVVQGRVQGVAFRNNTQITARSLNVDGWVRNLVNGDVEGCFEGDEPAVLALVEWCRCGPAAARVDNLIVHEEPCCGAFNGFEIRY